MIVCVAFAPVVARVEGEKEGFVACQPGGHVRFVRIHGKMHKGAFFVLEQGRSRRGHAVFGVLANGIPYALTRKGVFELDCGNGQAVERSMSMSRLLSKS